MMHGQVLTVTIPDRGDFYSLYADGLFSEKRYDKETGTTELDYPADGVVFLYYTYPTHREACVVRNAAAAGLGRMVTPPALSKRVRKIFGVEASRTDKLRRAAGFLNEHFDGGAYGFHDDFYLRLYFLLRQKGKINYGLLRELALGYGHV
jgi:hypothetical protein